MIQVIETNLSIDKDDTIRDHQSRIVEVEDWDTYCKAFEKYNGEAVYFKSKTMRGYSILSNCTMTDLDRKSTRLNSSHPSSSRMPSSA